MTGKNGQPVNLRYKSMSVLVTLAGNAGEEVSRQALIDTVWQDTHVSEDSLAQCIADIRKALGDDEKRILETVPRSGYRLNVTEPAPTAFKRRHIAAVAAALIAAFFLFGFYLIRQDRSVADEPVVAVLPLDDLSNADHQGYLNDAISEGLITELSRFPQFKVIARNSSFQFRDKPTDIRKIGQVLGADYVIEGSQQLDGDNLRVTIQLLETDKGTHILSKKIDSKIADLFSVQDKIVQQIAGVTGVSVLSDLPDKQSEGEVDSLLRGLQARKLMMQHFNRENLEKALALEEQSIREDPDSPWGYIGKSIILRNAAFQGWLDQPRDALLDQAEKLADKALRIAPGNYMSHYAMARVHAARKEYGESLLQFERAAELNPSDSNVLIAMSLPLLFTGQTDRAISALQKAKSVDPLHGDWLLWQLGWAYWQKEECEKGLDSMLSMASPPGASLTMLAALYICTGQIEKARETMSAFLEDRPGYGIADEIKLNPADWRPEGTRDRWLAAMKTAGMPGQTTR